MQKFLGSCCLSAKSINVSMDMNSLMYLKKINKLIKNYLSHAETSVLLFPYQLTFVQWKSQKREKRKKKSHLLQRVIW